MLSLVIIWAYFAGLTEIMPSLNVRVYVKSPIESYMYFPCCLDNLMDGCDTIKLQPEM